MKCEIEIEGLPEGWEPVAFRVPHHGEYVLFKGNVEKINGKGEVERLIIKKKQPRRIILEETDADNVIVVNGDVYQYQSFRDGTLYNKHKIWRIVEDTGERNDS